MNTTATAPAAVPTTRRVSRSVIVSAWAVPIMVVGGFAMLAIVPVALVLRGTLRDTRLRALRWWAAGLSAIYATPLALWAIGPERERSLTRDMDPIFVPLIVGAAVGFIAAYYFVRSRAGRDAA